MKNLAFSISLLGIFLLLLTINFIEITETNIDKITNKNLNEKIKVTGKTSDVKIFESNFTTFSINQKEESVTIICTCPEIKSKLFSK